jgi:quercetin dioxygenase-like cupin family protein
MSKAGDFFQNPVTGEAAIVRIGTQESGGELLVADLYLAPGSAVMGEHYHPTIEERFTLIRGELGIRLSGRAVKAKPGVTLLVPSGVPHNWWNVGDAEAVVRVEIRPAARFEAMILNAFGLAQDGRVDRSGMPNFLQLVVFAREFSDVIQFTRPPRLVQKVLFGLVAPFARLLGYCGSYPEYLTRRHEDFLTARRPIGPLRTFLAIGADDKEVAAWMAAQAIARREEFLRWCRQFQAHLRSRFPDAEDWLHRSGKTRKPI